MSLNKVASELMSNDKQYLHTIDATLTSLVRCALI